jgi:hypothetical protein
MRQLYTPIGDLAAAIAHAQYQSFTDIIYQDRNWERYRKWQTQHFDKLSQEEKRQLYDQERITGKFMGPADCIVTKTRRPAVHEITVVGMFPQTWSSTALGFGGIGGQAITTAYTVVLECNSEYAVYFGGRHAYTVQHPSEEFFQDLSKRQMREVSCHSVYHIQEG